MGCGFSDADWQSQLEEAEQNVFRACPGIVMDKLTCKYTIINMNDQNLAVRSYVYNDDRSKKTLLMTHGYAMASVYYCRILPALAEHYRIVMFDNLGWGLNSRTDDVGDALESADKAERWTVEWWVKVIQALTEAGDLPEKFYLSGHSAGGFQCMLYASYHPERIEGMFLQSPACTEDQTDPNWVYDPYNLRNVDTADVNLTAAEVAKLQSNYANNVHIQDDMHGVPYWMMKQGCKSQWKKMATEKFGPDALVEACALYYALMTQRWGNQEVVVQRQLLVFCFLQNPLHTPEKMMQDFDFPIAFVNGTRDFFGSAEGSNTIAANNRYYKDGSGRTQIFKLQNSGHNVFLDNPDKLTEYMIGFFNGTIRNTWDLKPRKEFVPDQ